MKFRPLHDRVLIKVLDSEEKTKGGIIIPDTAKEKPQKREKSLLWVMAQKPKMEKLSKWMLKLATEFYLESGPEQRLKSTVKNTA